MALPLRGVGGCTIVLSLKTCEGILKYFSALSPLYDGEIRLTFLNSFILFQWYDAYVYSTGSLKENTSNDKCSAPVFYARKSHMENFINVTVLYTWQCESLLLVVAFRNINFVHIYKNTRQLKRSRFCLFWSIYPQGADSHPPFL
jgi:hypothetical protein